MIVGFDAKRLFHNYTGLGYYSRTLVTSLLKYHSDFDVVLFDGNPVHSTLTKSYYQNHHVQIVKYSIPKSFHRSIYLNAYLDQSDAQIYHGLSNELPYIKNKKRPFVVTIHDLLYKYFPQDFPWFDRRMYQFKTARAIENADVVIAISQATKNDLIRYFPFAENKIKIMYQSYDSLFDEIITHEEFRSTQHAHSLPGEYHVYVGAVTYRKNLKVIIDAMCIQNEKERIPLIIAGKGTTYESYIKKYIAGKGLSHLIHFMPGISRQDLRILYHGARALIYPSLGEGFGLPVIEGIAADIPVITSNISSMPEAGGPCANYFDPTRADELASLLSKPSSLKSYAPSDRLSHLAKFSPSVLSEQILKNVYLPLV